MTTATVTVTVARPAPVDSDAGGQGLPDVRTPVCPPCAAPMTAIGLVAESPFGQLDGAACGYGVECRIPIVSAGELATHPKASCAIEGASAEFVAWSTLAVADKIAQRYGMETISPCWSVRAFRAGGCDTPIDGLLRLDKVEIADSCGCHRCDAVWRELQLCDLVVGPKHEAPWRTIGSCQAGAWCGGTLRITGIWSELWPIPAGVKLATILLTAKTVENAKSEGKVISNRETGEINVDVPEFDLAELALLPSFPFRYRGGGV